MSNKYYLIHLLILINIPTWAQDSSFTFNANDYVNITSDASLQAETGMTIECWVNPESDTYSDYSPLVHYFRLGGLRKNLDLHFNILMVSYDL